MGDTAKEQCGRLFSGDCGHIMKEMRQFCADMGANKKDFTEKYPHMAKMAGMMAGHCCGKSNKKTPEQTGDAKE
jgi:hypothetical protein